ncbi:hypothetical protein J6X15_01445 [Candidatus Saccharibacteria bacterium]|nr:hypothetical protein [Candidatus Saccharibacteria bacterium]
MELTQDNKKLKRIGNKACRKKTAGIAARVVLIIMIVGIPVIYWLSTLWIEQSVKPWAYDAVGHDYFGIMTNFFWISLCLIIWGVLRRACYEEVGARKVHAIKIEEKDFTYTYYPKNHAELAATIKLNLEGAEIGYNQEFDLITINATNMNTNQPTKIEIPNCFDQDLREVLKV